MDPFTRALLGGAAGAGGEKLYVEDVFSTWLYTGTGSTQTITNGIDLSGKGGLVWIKPRSTANSHILQDTARGASNVIVSNSLNAQQSYSPSSITSFSSDGFSLGSSSTTNSDTTTYASWTFRKAAKFFDVVTYTGNGSTNRQIAHNLGSVPGCIIVKSTSNSTNWAVYHRSTGNTQYLNLNETSAAATNNDRWNDTTPTSTVFTVGNGTDVNRNGYTYVAYLFAHDAGGFGDSGNDSVVSCGSYVGSTAGTTVDLGWEPQWILVKNVSSAENWRLHDAMRGMSANDSTTAGAIIYPNLSNAEGDSRCPRPTSTGFISESNLNSSHTFIYIAIRRGPMKTPTDATKVFKVNYETELRSSSGWSSLSGFPDDAFWTKRASEVPNWLASSRLTDRTLSTNTTAAESLNVYFGWDVQDGIKQGTSSVEGADISAYPDYHFRRAPGFFDVVAYTGTGSTLTVNHNLGVTPELIIGKCRSYPFTWVVYHKDLGTGSYIALNTSAASIPTSLVSAVSSTTFTGEANAMSYSGNTHVAYLFASCPGVSKVGSYTGTGTTLNIDCGFTNGARFVLIKRTDSTGDWYVWDTARGIVSGNDSYLLLNSTAAEVTNTDYIDPLSSGFQISSTAPAAINANNGSFIYLAVA